jgi:crossover junction endodeoxyribonuclease RuvC
MEPSEQNVICGIDPGLSGGLAFINPSKPGWCHVEDMPVIRVTKSRREIDVVATATIMHLWKPTEVFIEKVGAMPKQGVSSTFTFGTGYGILLGICGGLGLPLTLVRPTTWMAKALRDMPRGSKGASVSRATQLYPGVTLKTERGRVLDGRADALLIAWYGAHAI